jgi:hypothetical protein
VAMWGGGARASGLRQYRAHSDLKRQHADIAPQECLTADSPTADALQWFLPRPQIRVVSYYGAAVPDNGEEFSSRPGSGHLKCGEMAGSLRGARVQI